MASSNWNGSPPTRASASASRRKQAGPSRAAAPRQRRRTRRGPSQSWGSGGHRHWWVWVVGRQEFLPETGAERAVIEGAADLEQPIGPAPGPAPLLRLGHSPDTPPAPLPLKHP